jgi:hypothetical protein
MLFDEENNMKSKVVITIIILLISGLAFFYIPSPKQKIPQGFAPLDVLYHGSTNNNIKVFEPRNNNIRDKEEGPVVFATPSLKLASCYLFRWDDSWVHQSIFWKDSNKADYHVVMVISDKIKFEKKDNGGTVYILPSQGFDFEEHKGLGIYEWTHKGAVIPILKIDFSSALVAMEKLGVKVYFVEQEQFQHYLSLPGDAQEKFLLKLGNEK